MRAEKGFSNLVLAFVAVLLLGSVAFTGISPINLNAAVPSSPGNAGMSLGGSDDAEYLIITRPMFESALENLVSLKSQRMSVKVVTVEEIIGTTMSVPTTIDVEIDSGADPHDVQLKFDVSELKGKARISAKLWLYAYNVYPSWQGWCYVMRVDNQTWDETMTADESNNQPTDTSENTGTVWTTEGWGYVDVTTQLENNGGADNLTIGLSCFPYGCSAREIENTTRLNFGRFYNSVDAYSSEAVENHPYLEVTYALGGYPGRDIPEKIRNCIIDHYTNYGTQWVLLAGDADPDDIGNNNPTLDKDWEVPLRYVSANQNIQSAPTDYYYAGLDETWDADGDGNFGEKGEVDWFAEVYVGRFPARDVTTMSNIVAKTVNYESNPPETYYENVCLFGGETFPEKNYNGENVKKYIKNAAIPADVPLYEFYYKFSDWPLVTLWPDDDSGDSEHPTFSYVVNTYNPRLINVAAHGDYDRIRLAPSDEYWGEENIASVNTPARISNTGFLMYALSCFTNAFDWQETCVGEALLWDPDGGAVGYIGGMRRLAGKEDPITVYDPTVYAEGQDLEFFKEFFGAGEFRQGAALYKSKANYIESRYPSGEIDRRDNEGDGSNLFVTMLLGDPELSILPNQPPNEPSNPSPSDGATGVSTSPTLSVYASDPNGDSMDVTFHDASDDSLIGTDINVPSGGTASVTWSGLAYATTYSWYAVADDGMATTQSPTWSFTTASIVYGVDVSVSPSDWYGNPGDVLSIPVTVTNTGNTEDTYDLWAFAINWDTGAEYSPPISPNPITVPPYESRIATLTFTIPGDASVGGKYEMWVFADSRTDSSVRGSSDTCYVHVVFVIHSTFYPSDDADVSSVHPDKVFDVEIMSSGRSFLKFDLSSIPQDAIVMSASLHLRVGGPLCRDSNRVVVTSGVYEVEDDSWSEETITWNNQPDCGDLISYYLIDSTTPHPHWTDFDVTGWVQDQISGEASFCITYPTYQYAQWPVGYGRVLFVSKELLDIGGYEDPRPYLEIACGE